MQGVLIMVVCFFVGVVGGVSDFVPKVLKEDSIILYVLYLLLFVVGINMGADKRLGQMIKMVNFKLLLVPVTTIVGTSLGVVLVSFVFSDVSVREALAVGAGFGYYSLSSVIISKIHGEILGVVAFISNLIRELVTLLFAPVIFKYFGRLAPINAGGATTMDTTLPVLVKTIGKEYTIFAVFHGVVLTILVPFLVTFILTF